MALEIEIGTIFGKLTILQKGGNISNGKVTINSYLCKCECGNTKEIASTRLNRGRSLSCGCLRGLHRKGSNLGTYLKHSACGTGAYRSWCNLRYRCISPHNARYADYGGRGITFCDSWKDFNNFLNDMGERPDGYSIDRIDVNGNYEPKNCKWSSSKEQAFNKRNSIKQTL